MKIREIIVENDEEDMFGQSDRVGKDLRRVTYQQRIPSMVKMIQGNLEANAGPFVKQMAAELGRDADVFRRDPEIFDLADDLLTQEVMPQVTNILLSLDPAVITDEDALTDALTDHVANIRNSSDLWIYIEEILGDGDEDAAYMCAMTMEGEIGALLLKLIQQAYTQPGLSEGEIDEGVNDPHTFKCIFLFGPMGAGKSTVARPLLSHTGLRSVNLDNFNEMFVKKGQVPTGHLAPDQLEKSWQLSQTQQNNFANGRLGIIIDGSGRNPNTAINVIETLGPLGYEFMMIFVNVSEATSIARQQSRAVKQQQQWGVGRQVDPTLAKNTYTQVQKNLGRYSAYFGSERFVYVDNENTPDLTQATKKVDAFLRAPVTRPEALAWIQAQKGGQQVAQQQQKLATAQGRQQQALKQYNPLNPKFARQGMAEAPLADYVPMGDFNKPGPFRGADKKLVPHPVNQLKAQRFFEKTPYNFRLFFSNIPGTGKYSEYGVMDPDTVKIIFGDAGEQIVAGHEDAITVVYVGNSGDSKVMLTPWMMAHRLGHAMQSGTRGRSNNQQHPWKAGEDHFFGQVNSMLEEYYGKSGQRGGNLKAELTPEYNALFNAIGTQRSSRSGEIRRPYEFLYEIFAQYLGTGTVTFNALPANLGYGRKAWGNPSRYLNINPEYRDESARKQATEVLSYDMELMFNDALSNAEGKILVM